MKRLIAFLSAAILLVGLVPALAESLELPVGSIQIFENQRITTDLDGDGSDELIGWAMVSGEYEEECLTLTVEAAGGALTYPTDIIYLGQVYLFDLDGDGLREILITGDVASDDYYTWCLQYRGGRLTEVLFPDCDRGENTGGYFTRGYGLITYLGEYGVVELTGSQDMLGTWMASRRVTLDTTGRFEFCDNFMWERAGISYESEADLWEYGALTVKAPTPYIGEHGWEDGILNPGDKLLIYATDKQYEAHFLTPDDVTGILSISPNYEQGWGWLVDGVPEEDCFEYVPYAD